jgi:hypothetical protein
MLQPEMILETVEIVKDAVEKIVLVNLIVNNIIPRVDKFPTIFYKILLNACTTSLV